jgi:hypothetical protein
MKRFQSRKIDSPAFPIAGILQQKATPPCPSYDAH